MDAPTRDVDVVTYNEAARRLAVSYSRIQQLIAQGHLEKVEVGGPRTSRVTTRSIAAYLDRLVARGLAES